MELLDRVILQRKKLENIIDSIENARMNEGMTGQFGKWLRDELQVVDNGLAAIEFVMEKKEIGED